MTKGEALNLFSNLSEISGITKTKFNFAIARNISILKPEIMALQKALEGTKEFKEVDKKRIELAEKHSQKDDKGKPVMFQNRYILKDQAGFEKELEELKAKDKKIWAEREKQVEEYDELLKTKSDFKPYKLSMKDVPEDLETTVMKAVYPLLDEK